jgi:hypothetical protein
MSSSKSIAAARARRSGEQQQQQHQVQRPGTSIGSAKAFNQQPQQNQQPPQNQQLSQNYAQPGGKISISDAIGLITIRLGRAEQFLQHIQEEGGFNGGSGIPDNAQLIDKSVITNIISRIDSVEKRDSSDKFSKLEKEIKEIKDSLSNTMQKFNSFVSENEKRFDDFEAAFIELEKNLLVPTDTNTNIELNNIVLTNNETEIISNNIQLNIEENQ